MMMMMMMVGGECSHHCAIPAAIYITGLTGKHKRKNALKWFLCSLLFRNSKQTNKQTNKLTSKRLHLLAKKSQVAFFLNTNNVQLYFLNLFSNLHKLGSRNLILPNNHITKHRTSTQSLSGKYWLH